MGTSGRNVVDGFAWDDSNGNGTYDVGESPRAGVTAFVDADNDSQLDAGETTTTTDSNGRFSLAGPFGTATYVVLRDPVDNTFLTSALANGNGFNQEGAAYGAVRSTAVASGSIFNDLNNNGAFDSGEPGLAGRTVFVDYDNDGVLDANEPSTMTSLFGNWRLGAAAGTWRVRTLAGNDYAFNAQSGSYAPATFV